MNPPQIEPELQRALACHRSGQVEAARSLYRALLEADPTHFNALQLLGVLELQAGSPGEGVELLERALRIKPKAVDTWVNHARAMHLVGRGADALASVNQALALRPESPDALKLKAKLLTDLARKEEAVACHTRLLSQNPHDLDALMGRSALLVDLGRASEALADATAAVKRAPDAPDRSWSTFRRTCP